MIDEHNRRIAELHTEIGSIYNDMRLNVMNMMIRIGPRPPWWRPFARRRWDRMMAMIDRGVIKLEPPEVAKR